MTSRADREKAPRFAAHPKVAANRNFDAKVRQQLQRGPYKRISRSLWEATK